MGQARGHCNKINNLYSRYLYPWFDRVLPRADVEVLADLFRSLDQFDGQMLRTIDGLADWLTLESSEVLNLIDAEKFGEVNQRVRAARKDVLPQRQAISHSMRTLLDLQAEFIGLSGAI
jgi:hypothetical protein